MSSQRSGRAGPLGGERARRRSRRGVLPGAPGKDHSETGSRAARRGCVTARQPRRHPARRSPKGQLPQRLEDVALDLRLGITARPRVLRARATDVQPARAVEQDRALAVEPFATVLADIAAAPPALPSHRGDLNKPTRDESRYGARGPHRRPTETAGFEVSWSGKSGRYFLLDS